MTAVWLGVSPARRDLLARRVRLLVAATITWNVAEAAVAITAGTVSSSAALLGFGLDSVVEVSSAAAVAWQFSARDHDVSEGREKTTLRVIALSFFALAAYVTADSAHALASGGTAGRSVPGIALAALSLAVMPVLSAAQRRAGRELGSGSAVADSKQALLCTYLSAVLLAGLVLNARAWLVLGGPRRRACHRRARGPGRPGSLAGQRLLRGPARHVVRAARPRRGDRMRLRHRMRLL
jgi:divalent metal cation (Fe/Co/Zn/Cd) transporter